MELVPALRFFNLLTGGVVIGALVMEARVILPVFQELPNRTSLELARVFGPRAWASLSAVGVSFVFSGFGLAFLRQRLPPTSAALTVAAALILVPSVISNLGIYLPYDTKLRRLSPDQLPPDYPQRLRRMARLNLLRLTFFTVAYLGFLAATVWDDRTSSVRSPSAKSTWVAAVGS